MPFPLRDGGDTYEKVIPRPEPEGRGPRDYQMRHLVEKGKGHTYSTRPRLLFGIEDGKNVYGKKVRDSRRETEIAKRFLTFWTPI